MAKYLDIRRMNLKQMRAVLARCEEDVAAAGVHFNAHSHRQVDGDDSIWPTGRKLELGQQCCWLVVPVVATTAAAATPMPFIIGIIV